jgi:dsDNA-binding SOS-regulon protein
LGSALTGKEVRIKLLMAEHKDAVSEILRTMVAGQEIRY